MSTETCWADSLTRAERRVLREKLTRACRAVFAARPNWHEDGHPNPWLRTSDEMADLHMDVTERAEVAAR